MLLDNGQITRLTASAWILNTPGSAGAVSTEGSHELDTVHLGTLDTTHNGPLATGHKRSIVN